MTAPPGTSFDTGIGAPDDRLVFTFTLNSDGSHTFTLHDQIDHDPPNDTTDEAGAAGSAIRN